MKAINRWVWVGVVLAGLAASGSVTTSQADEERERELAMRLERLEDAVQRLAQRPEPAGPRGGPGVAPRPPLPPGGPRPMLDPRPGPGQPPEPPEVRVKWHGDKVAGVFWRLVRCLRAVMFVLAIVHVLLAIWVYTDIKKRGEGHGIFIVLALLAGIPAAILYALVRIGDRKEGTKATG